LPNVKIAASVQRKAKILGAKILRRVIIPDVLPSAITNENIG
jgi:hypothetical protein